ncbi:MAG: hypothetical protein KDC45_01230 [Bacteroidetes bacterium]|nr:hypothetical protein [Bacteroidota bacterium]
MNPSEKGHGFLDIILTVLFLGISVPALVQLFAVAVIGTTSLEIESRAVYLCEQKLEQIATDKMSPSRGYSYVTTTGRYPSESLTSGFTRTTTVTPNLSFNGVSYTSVVVSVSHPDIASVSMTTWITRY